MTERSTLGISVVDGIPNVKNRQKTKVDDGVTVPRSEGGDGRGVWIDEKTVMDQSSHQMVAKTSE